MNDETFMLTDCGGSNRVGVGEIVSVTLALGVYRLGDMTLDENTKLALNVVHLYEFEHNMALEGMGCLVGKEGMLREKLYDIQVLQYVNIDEVVCLLSILGSARKPGLDFAQGETASKPLMSDTFLPGAASKKPRLFCFLKPPL